MSIFSSQWSEMGWRNGLHQKRQTKMTSPGAGLQVLGQTNQLEKDIAETSGEVAKMDQNSDEKERVLISGGGMVVFCSAGNALPFQRCLLVLG